MGYEEVVKIFLEREDINPDLPDTEHGRTPLSWAAWNGHEGIVNMLLQREDVNPDREDTYYGQAPLSLAAENGHEGVVKMLLERDDVDPDQPDTWCGRTPLAWAALYGHGRVVRMLLERQDVRPTALDHRNQTPLSLALSKGHNEVVRIFHDNANPYTTDRGDQTSLPPSAGHLGGRAVDMEPQSHDPNTRIIGFNAQPPFPPADPDEREVVSDHTEPLPRPADSDLPSTKQSRLRQLHSWLPKLSRPPRKTNCHSNNYRSALSLALDRYYLIASLICLLAFLAYIFPPSLPHILSSYK